MAHDEEEKCFVGDIVKIEKCPAFGTKLIDSLGKIVIEIRRKQKSLYFKYCEKSCK